ncbi:Male-specific lethal 1 [Orchesella cincta]|uniref:Male-specific lethal 1 n=1 Tax=Orchesella cincta TaxID=48709 RepID=A0A1D2MSC3_ORCCI|nr:Male-specific lethal 1 [Orchesella cincta]
MGASKEGMMRVREKINLVLSDPDPEDGCSGSTAVANCDASFISKAGGERVEDRGVGGSGNFRSFERNHLDQQQAGKFTGQTQGPSSSAVSDVCSKNGVERLLCRRHVEILQILGKQKREAETTYMSVSSERDQLAISLQSEREERARLQQVNASLLEQKNRAEDTVKQKEEMIIELQRQLLIANSKKLVEEKSTCTSPRPLSPPSSSPSEQPPLKRARLDNNENSFALPPPPEATGTIQMRFENIKSSSSSSSVSFNIHRSNSPPQLSPAVTPRSLSQKSYSGSRNSVKALFGFDDDEESDDFEDELQCLTTTPLQEADKPSSSTSYFAPQDSPVPTSQHSAFACSSSDRADDYFNSTFFPGESSPNSHSSHLDKHSNSPDILKFKPIQRPRPNNFFRHHHGRTLQPEVRRRFNTSSLIRSRLPDASKQLNSFFAPKNFSNDNANNFQSTSISTPSQSQQAISVRNNNFLNVSRSVPSSKDLSSSSSLIPTDDISGGQENHSQSFRSLSDFDRINEEGMPETVTSPSKKRAVGRPPGSIKKRVPGPSTPAVFSSPSPGPSSSNSNGVVEQKFSKRGRLLKPNRARYSPDPDISVNSREKCITTRKSYFMPESAAQEEEESPEAPPTTPAPPVVEEEPISSAPCDVVEVPKWRINVVEGYEYELDRPIPDDDMSDEAFLKRHQKLEAKEKQRKRWDSQRLREETYREKLRMRQEERERQKELRRLQRKRKGRAGCTSDEEQESLLPTIDDVKAIFISPELPVGAFGFTLPLVEKVDFQLLWRPEVRKYINISTEMPTTTTTTDKVLNPSPSSLIPSSLQSLPPVSSQKPELSASSSCSISSNSIPLIDLDTNSARRNNSNFVSDSIGTDNCSAGSFTDSRVCSGVGKGIVVEFDNKSNTETNRKLLSNPSSFDVTTTITITEELGECSSPTPIFTIDLVDFRNENNTDSNGSSSGSSSSRTNVSDDNDVLPSITIPSSSRYHCESSRNSSKKETCDSMASKVVDIGLLKVSCPPLSYSVSNNTNVVSSTSFKFVIPTNPLAPRQSSPGSLTRPPPVSSPPKPGPRSQNNVVSTLSQVSEADEICRDNIRS